MSTHLDQRAHFEAREIVLTKELQELFIRSLFNFDKKPPFLPVVSELDCACGIALFSELGVVKRALRKSGAAAEDEHRLFFPVRVTAEEGRGIDVSLFVRGNWVPIIRDYGSSVSHIVEPSGIEKCIEEFFGPHRGASKKP